MRRTAPRADVGAAAVEFAIVVPLLVVFMLGTMSYGFFFFQATGAEHASREAARMAAVGTLNVAAPLPQVRERAPSSGITGASTCYRNTNGEVGYNRGDTLEVRVTWLPALRFGTVQFPWADPVAFVPNSSRIETGITLVEKSVGVPVPSTC